MTDYQLTTLWLGAFRYYCGRMTYAVGDFCELLCEAWPDLPEKLKALIQRELDEEFFRDNTDREFAPEGGYHHNRLGQDCDRAEWEKVRSLWT